MASGGVAQTGRSDGSGGSGGSAAAAVSMSIGLSVCLCVREVPHSSVEPSEASGVLGRICAVVGVGGVRRTALFVSSLVRILGSMGDVIICL